MATKEQAIRMCKFARKQTHFERKYYIYRIGAAWMFTRLTKEEVQKAYKKRIAEYQEIE